MMHLVVLAAMVVATFSQVTRVDLDEWHSYKMAFNKQYNSAEKEHERFKIFLDNLNYIRDHNERYNNGEVTYRVGINEFSDMTAEEKAAKMLGALGRLNETNQVIDTYWMELENDLPASIDWRQKGAVTPVKNQGMCGSCWAFSATGSLEGQYFIKTGHLESLSEQNLLDCDRKSLGCTGGWPKSAFLYIRNNQGIDSESAYPYKAVQGTCRYSTSGKAALDSGAYQVSSGNESALQNAVATKGPVSVLIDSHHYGFFHYSGGLFKDSSCSRTKLDHAVLVVGYGTTSNGEDYWLIKNSWGTSWGLQGYMMLARNEHNMCGVATDATFPIV